jgi:hypothetical protein
LQNMSFEGLLDLHEILDIKEQIAFIEKQRQDNGR